MSAFGRRLVDTAASIASPSGGVLHASGRGRAAPLLFLHGAGGGAWSWKPQVGTFRGLRPTYAWEARGHGDALRVSDAGFDEYVCDAREGLQAVLERHAAPPFLIGHSLGALIALALAAERPAIRGVVLIEGAYHESRITHAPSGVQNVARALVRTVQSSARKNGLLMQAISRAAFSLSFSDAGARARYWRYQRAQVPREYPRLIEQGVFGISGFDALSLARRIAVPVLSINGRDAQFDAELREHVPRLETVRVAGGHYIQLDRPHAVNAALATFIEAEDRVTDDRVVETIEQPSAATGERFGYRMQ